MLKRTILFAGLAGMLVLTGCVITARASVPRATVTVSGPPAIVGDDDPELVVIPGTYVYWLDGHDDVYFSGGVWWRVWDGSWYRSDVYRGPWVKIDHRRVPRHVIGLPHGWRQRRHEAPRVRWNDTRTRWKSWERDRYWEKRKWRKGPPPPGR